MPGFIRHATQATGTDAGNGEIRKAQWNADHTLDGVPYVIAQSAVAASVGAVTTEAVLATITVPAGAMGPNGIVEILVSWSVTNGANNKTLNLRVGGVAGSLLYQNVITTSNYICTYKWLFNVNSQSSQKSNNSGFGWPGITGITTNAPFTSSVDTSAAWDIVISGQKAVAGDTITLETYSVKVVYGA